MCGCIGKCVVSLYVIFVICCSVKLCISDLFVPIVQLVPPYYNKPITIGSSIALYSVNYTSILCVVILFLFLFFFFFFAYI